MKDFLYVCIMNYRLTKLKDTRFEGVHPNGVDEGFVYEGNMITELEVGKPFIIFEKGGRFLRTSTVTKINSETEFETLNSVYKIEKII